MEHGRVERHKEDSGEHYRGKDREIHCKVFVFDLKTQKQIREFRCELTNRDSRKWLMDMMHWAIANNKSVEIVNLCDLP